MHPNFDLILPFLKHQQELENELLLSGINIIAKNAYYLMVPPLTQKPIWAQEWLPKCQIIQFHQKNEAVKRLKAQKNLGVFLPTTANQKLASAIQKELRELKLKRLKFEVPSAFNFKYFVWTLHSDNQIIICETPNSQFPLGWHEFNEDKNTPPNRAYLKLWEILTLNYITLKPSDVVVDLGSSPGGWSWTLSEFVKKVYSVDRSPLAPQIASRKNIEFTAGDAFAVDPARFKDCQWMFSDIICTPQRLLELIHNWQQHSDVKNFVCTIKFKGLCDFDMLTEFNKITGSRIIHLYQNKNEVTWIKQDNS